MQVRQKNKQNMTQIYIHLAALTHISVIPLCLWEEAFQNSDMESAFLEVVMHVYGAIMLEKYGERIFQCVDVASRSAFQSSEVVGKINQLPDKLVEMIPASIKELGKSIGMCSTTAYLTYAIKNKRCAENLYFELDKTVTQSEATELLDAIKIHRPKGLKVGYNEVFSLPSDSRIRNKEFFGFFREKLQLVAVLSGIHEQLLKNEEMAADFESQQNRP